MNRRDLLSSFALTAFVGDGQETVPPSLYVPNAHPMDDRKLLHDFMEEFAFVDLIGVPRACSSEECRKSRRCTANSGVSRCSK